MAIELRKWDPAEHIRDDEEARFYLEAVLEDGTPEEIAEAIQTVARAKGMRQLAEQTGLSRDALDLVLNPFDGLKRTALLQVIEAFGVHPQGEGKKTDAA